MTESTTAGDPSPPEKIIGERLVRVEFNPSNNSEVDQIKQKTAELINMVDKIASKDPRLAGFAVDAYEEAAMWAVKCATA